MNDGGIVVCFYNSSYYYTNNPLRKVFGRWMKKATAIDRPSC